MAAKILIGTPVYDEQVLVPYHVSILNLMARFQGRAEVGFVMALPTSSLISFSRNVLATRVLEDASLTHLLFIDADMGFRPELIEKMLAFDEPYVGAFCPARTMNYETFARLARERPEATDLKDLAQTYVGEPWRDARGVGQARGEFLRASRVGTGILLLQRTVSSRCARPFRSSGWSRRRRSTAGRASTGACSSPSRRCSGRTGW
jgi:hypothetical protein